MVLLLTQIIRMSTSTSLTDDMLLDKSRQKPLGDCRNHQKWLNTMHGVQCCEGGIGDTVASFIVASSWESAVGKGGR